MKQSDMVTRVNQLVYEGLYTFDEIKFDFDDAIGYINENMHTSFPNMSDLMADTDSEYTYDVPTVVDGVEVNVATSIFPEVYEREIVINFVVASLFRREGEFGNEYYMAIELYTKGMARMFRDYFEKVPTQFKDSNTGFIAINPDAVVEEDDPVLDPTWTTE